LFNVGFGQLSSSDWITNGLVLVTTALLLVFFERRQMRQSRLWLATVTPLASIIGSGFLVVAPLLGFIAGSWATLAMIAIVALAYFVGAAVRYNIAHVEDITEADYGRGGLDRALTWMERAGKMALVVAYIIAITFYVELLGAFVLRPFGFEGHEVLQKAVATGLLIFIGGFGLWRGLRQLEGLEKYAVDIKLSIIAGFLVALAFVNAERITMGAWDLPSLDTSWDVDTLRKLLGAFLIVQGFETSRYLRGAYSADTRIITMRYAQWISAGIYVAFVALATIFFGMFHTISETGIITLSSSVAFTLPALLIIGAVMSQFSAAVADTIGSGGLLEEVTRGYAKHQWVYAGVASLSIVLLWSSNIFTVIAYASRAFAAYYMVQCAMAALYAATRGRNNDGGWAYVTGFAALSMAMLAIAVFGIPAETVGGNQ
jgi:hypothetical protein